MSGWSGSRIVFVGLIVVVMALGGVTSAALGAVGEPGTGGSALQVSSTSSLGPSAGSSATSSPPSSPSTTCDLTPSEQSHLLTSSNDPSWAEFIQHTKEVAAGALAAGLPAADLHLPYLGAIPDQNISGLPETGVQITSGCPENNATDPAPAPAGVNYVAENDLSGTVTKLATTDSNSLLGILNVNSDQNFYPDSATPTEWGAQLNTVLANVSVYYAGAVHLNDFWVQNVVSYDSHNDTLYFVDDTWNFTTSSSEMQPSSLVSWSPNGSDYTGVWVAFSHYYYAPPPFSAYVYVNTSVNSAGDQVLWYNYSVLANGHNTSGSYDDLVFQSQAPGGPITPMEPPAFEASATTKHEVNEGYEFDAFIGADDGSNQLILNLSATEQLEYCTVPIASGGCTNSAYTYASVPAAENFGSQTGEQTVGVDVNYVGQTAYLSAGPLIEHGLWGYSGQAGNAAGNTKVLNALSVSGSPVPVVQQPYIFVFLEDSAITSQGYQWAPDQPAWYLMPGTYNYELMLTDYQEQTGTLTVGATTTTLTATLPYSASSGFYTPLWAFDNGQLAGISQSGAGTINDQYILFNNPTSSCTLCGSAANGNLSTVFDTKDDYDFPSFAGIFLNGTSAYVDVNAPPSLGIAVTSRGTTTNYYLDIQFYETSNVTLSNAAAIRGWPQLEEISFYITVPASQNPAPQADVFVWNSTHDLIMSNHFVATVPASGDVAPDLLLLFGGTDNVVWGNTFRDPPGTTLSTTGNYAGIGEAESGDLIYNNVFDVDNPVVFLPYNIPNVADCLPQCESSSVTTTLAPFENFPGSFFFVYPHDTWNVTPQPASNVAETVNGFGLSGNILGSGYSVVGGASTASQGGNYFWNYGTSPNNQSTLPYVSRFYYSDWSNIYPLGCGTIQAPGAPCGTAPAAVGAYQNGIPFGGDYAPIIAVYPVSFSETGLPAGVAWFVNVTGGPSLSGTVATLSTTLGNGSYPFTVAASGPYSAPAPTPLVVNGASRTVSISFTMLELTVGATVNPIDVGLTTTISAVASGGSGTFTGYAWSGTVPGCSVASETGASFSCTPSTAGTYTIGVTVTDSNGGHVSGSLTLVVTPPPSGVISASPNPTQVGASSTVSFSVTNGVPPVTWTLQVGGVTVASGTTPSSYVFDPSAAGSYTFYLNSTDSLGNVSSASTTVLVEPALAASLAASASAIDVGQSSLLTLGFSGGVVPVTWTLEESGVVGNLSGVSGDLYSFAPSSAGVYTFYLNATDSVGSVSSVYTLVTVSPSLSAGTASATVNPVDVGQATTVRTSGASGGTGLGTYTYAWTDLPPGCSSTAASFSCTPGPTALGAYDVVLTVTDGNGNTALASFTLTVDPSLSAGTVSATVNPVLVDQATTISTTGATGGAAPYTFAWSGLPPGCSAGNAASFACTPTLEGVYTVQVTVTDANGNTASSSFSLVVGAIYQVTFTESGLTVGTTWYVNLTGGASLSGSGTTLSTYLPNGTYRYTVASLDKRYAAPAGMFTVDGAAVPVAVGFSLQTYTVTFTESGLPAKTLAKDGWTVVMVGTLVHSTSASIVFPRVSNGTYGILVTGPAGETVNVGGYLTVSGTTNLPVTMVKGTTYTLTLSESGLPKGEDWCRSVNEYEQCTSKSSATYVNLTSWLYSYAVIAPLAGQSITAKIGKKVVPTAGLLALSASTKIAYTFVYDYAVTFTETGAPSGTWSVTIGTTTLSNATGDPIVFELPNGTYSYRIGAISGYTSVGSPKKVVVNGAAVPVSVTYTKRMPVPRLDPLGVPAARAAGDVGAVLRALGAVPVVVGVTAVVAMLGAGLALARTGRRPGDEGER